MVPIRREVVQVAAAGSRASALRRATGLLECPFHFSLKAMRVLARALLLVLVALPVLAIAAVWLCLEDAPSVVRAVALTPQDIANAKRIIDRHDPRMAADGARRTVVISEQDLDLMLNYAASRFGRGAARAALRPGTVSLQASVEIPANPFGRYLNVDAVLRETGSLPGFDRLLIGRLRVPAVVADYLLRESLRAVAATDRGALAAAVVQGASFADGRLAVTYVWSRALGERARTVLLPAADVARLRAYQERLVETVSGAPGRVSLAALMPPLFRTARDRAAAGGDPIAENRAAIIVLALYVNGTDPETIASSAARWPKPAQRTVTLADRSDFPKHFLISALIAAEAGSPLADAVGLHKEIEDSRGGSGFSFNDIAADRAGTRFGELASGSPLRARELALALADGVSESDFMPEVADLPEFMPEAQFRQRYGGVGAPAYEQVMTTIESRVASRPLLR